MKNNSNTNYNHYKPPYHYALKFRGGFDLKKPDSPAVQPIPASESEPASCPVPAKENSHGLLRYRDWWERVRVQIATGGERIDGIPIFVKDETLRVINDDYSYFIPLSKIDYIRTDDGLRSSFL